MPVQLIEALGALSALTIVGSFGLAFTWLRLRHKERTSSPLPATEFERLAEVVDDLSTQVRTLSIEYTELQERLDFTERLLTEHRSGRAHEVTPV